MKVTIVVGGRFHAFDLAEQFYKSKFLKQLTSYPKYYINKNFNIESKFIKSFFKEILHRSLKKSVYLIVF